MKNKACVIITSINAPSLAVRRYVENPHVDTIIVADEKTPEADYAGLSCEFLSLEKQKILAPRFHELLPFNHYARKNMGYLYAIKNGYRRIIETDDDNIPMKNWSDGSLHPEKTVGAEHYIVEGPKFVNIYNFYTDINIWPRGLPMNHILRKNTDLNRTLCSNAEFFSNVSIIQGLVDGDPDVDAIFRLTANESLRPVIFDDVRTFHKLGEGQYCPANTQNTVWLNPEDFPLLYVPGYVSFRFCDILKMYIAQALIRRSGRCLAFQGATVFQDRNPHDFFEDFLQELEMYLNLEKLISVLDEVLESPPGKGADILLVYELLVRHGIIKDSRELELLGAWLEVVAVSSE